MKLDSKSSQSETLKKMGIPVTNQESLDALYDKIYEDTSDTTWHFPRLRQMRPPACCRTKTWRRRPGAPGETAPRRHRKAPRRDRDLAKEVEAKATEAEKEAGRAIRTKRESKVKAEEYQRDLQTVPRKMMSSAPLSSVIGEFIFTGENTAASLRDLCGSRERERVREERERESRVSPARLVGGGRTSSGATRALYPSINLRY